MPIQGTHRNIQLPKFEANPARSSKICRDNPWIAMEAKNDPT